MGLPVLILGHSGSGKSSSMRNFKPDELALANVNGKFLPFRGKFTETINSDNYQDVTRFMKSAKAKTIVVDDSQYLIANEFMRRSKEKGYDKFTEMGNHFWELIRNVEALPGDVIVYFLHHIEQSDSGRMKAKTVGKMLDEKIVIEGMVSVVLRADVSDDGYQFATQSDGLDPCKTPMGMFSEVMIPNDLKFVDESIRTYYGLTPEHYCSDCGAVIMPTPTRSVADIVAGSTNKFGCKLCLACGRKRAENAAENVSE